MGNIGSLSRRASCCRVASPGLILDVGGISAKYFMEQRVPTAVGSLRCVAPGADLVVLGRC